MRVSSLVAIAAMTGPVLAGSVEPGVAWYGDWDAARAEAQRSQRPIMLQFARPACQGISGVF